MDANTPPESPKPGSLGPSRAARYLIAGGIAVLLVAWVLIFRYAESFFDTMTAEVASSSADDGEDGYLLTRYTANEIKRAREAHYPDFGFDEVPMGAEEAYYGTHNPMRALFKPHYELLHMVRTRQYDALASYFQQFQTALEANTIPEAVYRDATTSAFLEKAGPDDLQYFDEWVARQPDSYLAQGYRGMYLSQMGWLTRGRKFIRETSQESLKGFEEYLEQARPVLDKALAMHPQFLAAHLERLYDAKNGSGDEELVTFQDSAKVFPASFVLRDAHMEKLYPRWGGSHLEMRIFALQSQQYAQQNPRLRALLGEEAWDIADQLDRDKDFDKAIPEYRNGLYHGVIVGTAARLAELYLEFHDMEHAEELGLYTFRNLPGEKAMRVGQLLGEQAYLSDHHDQAWELLTEVVRRDVENQTTSSINAYFQSYDAERAKQLFQQLVAESPRASRYYFALASNQAETHDPQASATYAKYLALCQDGGCNDREIAIAHMWASCMKRDAACSFRPEIYTWALKDQ